MYIAMLKDLRQPTLVCFLINVLCFKLFQMISKISLLINLRIEINCCTIITESAKSRALRAHVPYVLNVLYVPACSTCPTCYTCPRAIRARVPYVVYVLCVSLYILQTRLCANFK